MTDNLEKKEKGMKGKYYKFLHKSEKGVQFLARLGNEECVLLPHL